MKTYQAIKPEELYIIYSALKPYPNKDRAFLFRGGYYENKH